MDGVLERRDVSILLPGLRRGHGRTHHPSPSPQAMERPFRTSCPDARQPYRTARHHQLPGLDARAGNRVDRHQALSFHRHESIFVPRSGARTRRLVRRSTSAVDVPGFARRCGRRLVDERKDVFWRRWRHQPERSESCARWGAGCRFRTAFGAPHRAEAGRKQDAVLPLRLSPRRRRARTAGGEVPQGPGTRPDRFVRQVARPRDAIPYAIRAVGGARNEMELLLPSQQPDVRRFLRRTYFRRGRSINT